MKRLFGSIVLGLCLICGGIANAAEVTVGWNGSEYASGYKVHYKAVGEDKFRTAIDVKDVCEYTLTIDPENDDAGYYFTVSAYNQYGSSAKAEGAEGVIEGTHLDDATPLLGMLMIVYPDGKTVMVDLQKNIITTTSADGEVSTVNIN